MSSKFVELAHEQVIEAEYADDEVMIHGDAYASPTQQPLTPPTIKGREEPNKVLVVSNEQTAPSQVLVDLEVRKPETLRSSLLFRTVSSSDTSSDDSPSPSSTTTEEPSRRASSIRKFRLATLANERLLIAE